MNGSTQNQYPELDDILFRISQEPESTHPLESIPRKTLLKYSPLRRAREQKYMTQRQLAKAVGLDRKTVSRHERVRVVPIERQIIAYETALGRPRDFLFPDFLYNGLPQTRDYRKK